MSLLKITLIASTLFLITFLYTQRVSIKRYYFLKTTDVSNSTGAIPSTTVNSEKTILGNSIEELQRQLPYINDKFTVTSFDYKTARFIVEFNVKSVNSEEEFWRWLESSSFSAIPQKRFKIN